MTPAILKPARLKKNATIGIIAPASPMKEDKLERGIRYLERQGYRIESGKSLYRKYGYLAGPDEARAADINAMFARREIDAIFCARGGYGTPRLLDLIDYDLIRKNPKIFVGYSDLTALQLAIFSQTGLVSFSGPMVAVEFASGPHPRTEEGFWQMLCDPRPQHQFKPLLSRRYGCARPGVAQGRLLGGCLSLISGLLGSAYMPDFRHSILVFEDIGEKLYKLDYYLAQLKNAGILRGLRGVVTGELTDSDPDDPQASLTFDQILEDYFGPLQIPVLTDFDYGHGGVKHTIPLGIEAHLDADSGTLMLREAAVV